MTAPALKTAEWRREFRAKQIADIKLNAACQSFLNRPRWREQVRRNKFAILNDICGIEDFHKNGHMTKFEETSVIFLYALTVMMDYDSEFIEQVFPVQDSYVYAMYDWDNEGEFFEDKFEEFRKEIQDHYSIDISYDKCSDEDIRKICRTKYERSIAKWNQKYNDIIVRDEAAHEVALLLAFRDYDVSRDKALEFARNVQKVIEERFTVQDPAVYRSRMRELRMELREAHPEFVFEEIEEQ